MKRIADCASAAVGLRARQIAQATTAAEIARKVTQRVARSEMVGLSGDVLSVLSMCPSSNLPIDKKDFRIRIASNDYRSAVRRAIREAIAQR